MWLTGKNFPETLSDVAEFLGYEFKSEKSSIDSAKDLEFIDWNEQLVSLWCLRKRPIKPESIRQVGGRIAIYRKRFKVIALPVWRDSFDNIVGWRVMNITGGTLPKFKPKNNQPEWVKTKMTYGSSHGCVGFLKDSSKEIWKVEGETDLLSMLSVHPEKSVICNSNGAGQKPSSFLWLEDRIANVDEFRIIHDSDKPGQQGAESWSNYFASLLGTRCNVTNVKLPYEVAPKKGKDIRDWFNEGNTNGELSKLASSFDPIPANIPLEIEESEDDPHRLARINLKEYERKFSGRLVFWQNEWWKYKDGCYRKIDREELHAKLNASIRREFEKCWEERQESNDENADKPVRKVTRSLVSNVASAMQSMITIPSSIKMPMWLKNRRQKNFLSMKNGILNLDAFFSGGEIEDCLLDHSDQWFSSFRLDYKFNPDAECEKFLDYIQFATQGDQEKIDLLQEWAGYLLLPSTREQKFLVFEGDGGTGKSSFFAAMTAMVGDDNVSSVSLENFKDSFGLQSTLGKVANIAGDVGRIDGNEEAVLKRYTGGDKIQVNRKNIPSVDVRPTAKLMMAWNERPRFRDKSYGLWRRMILIPLENRVQEKNRVKGMDHPEFWIDEAPGIMTWALVGLARLIDQGGFSPCAASEKALNEMQTDANPVRQFFDDYITTSKHSSIESSRLYSMYSHWCSREGFRPMSNRSFGKQVKKCVPMSDRKRVRHGTTRAWCYYGIAWAVEEILEKRVDDEKLF